MRKIFHCRFRKLMGGGILIITADGAVYVIEVTTVELGISVRGGISVVKVIMVGGTVSG